ncbi:hypothetical protein C5Y96_14770 [Blastopirellula marina]|uniref:Uncharacterized protein n=1 Tax=Blastopirellula marina TaxID=124 RepID=A0A2S8FEW6_9BACT|nr:MULTISPECIES: hypothetical protein [Pirellulaceae]PQO30721.1 hypothetical protein C5Y96_14770 [Blastopirellula marina]RCS50858.1 hypothetical protein DTL36_14780 [Bremerella cremea]
MWRVFGAVATIFFGAAVTYWQMNPGPTPPYDTWSISDEEALDVAEAILRYQIENEVSGRKAKRGQWLFMVFGDVPSAEFTARFHEFPQVIKSYSEVDPGGDTVIFMVKSAKRFDDTTILAIGKVYGGNDSQDKPLIGLAGDEDLNGYRVEQNDGVWEVAAVISS